MYLHGLRRGEAAILTLDCFQDGTVLVRRLKGGISLRYEMFPSSRALLRQYLAMRGEDDCPLPVPRAKEGLRADVGSLRPETAGAA